MDFDIFNAAPGSPASPRGPWNGDKITKLFRKYDRSGSGVLPKKEVQDCLLANARKLGLSQADVMRLIEDAASVANSGDGQVRYAQYAQYLHFELMKRGQATQAGATTTTAAGAGIAPLGEGPRTANRSKIKRAGQAAGQARAEGEQPFGDIDFAFQNATTTQPAAAQPTTQAAAADDFLSSMFGAPAKPAAVQTSGAGGLFAGEQQKPKHSPGAVTGLPDFFAEMASGGTVTQADPFGFAAENPGPGQVKVQQHASDNPFDAFDFLGGGSGATSEPKPAAAAKSKNEWEDFNTGGDFDLFDPIEPAKKEKEKPVTKIVESDDSSTDGSESASDTDGVHDADDDKKKKKKNDKEKKEPEKEVNSMEEMWRGTAMLKYGRRGFPHFRRFQISRDNNRFQWYSRKKKLHETSILLHSIHEIAAGQTTDIFKKCKQPALEKASFSIIYGLKRKSLDVVAKSPEEAKMWIHGLQFLVKERKAGKDLREIKHIACPVKFTDITRPGYRGRAKGRTTKPGRGTSDPNLRANIQKELQRCLAVYENLLAKEKSLNSNIPEYTNIKTLLAEMEERFEDSHAMLNASNADLNALKRDVWILKVDVCAMEDKLLVILAAT